MNLHTLLTGDEFTKLCDEAVANGFYRNDRRILLPGMAWECPWIFDPSGERERNGKYVMIKESQRGQLGHLSQHYWDDWSRIRPPMVVVCPNGEEWEIDRKSSNGTGWTVTGEFPALTAMPSIVVRGYHGWLKNGEFSHDLEGRGPSGVSR